MSKKQIKLPLVSVIIPVYNMGKYIRECLDTIISQSLKNIEIICVDDGSTDDSRDIISEYAKKDKRVILLTQKNQGAGPARNNGIRHAQGEFIAFMDPDDYYPEKTTLQKMYNAAKEHNVLICGGCFSELHNGEIRTTFDKNGNFWGYTFDNCAKIRYQDWQFDYGYHRFLYKRKFLKDNNLYFPPLLRFQDPPFFIKAMATAKEFYALNYPTYVYRTSYKQVVYKQRKLQDMMRGLIFDLQFSKGKKLAKLHYLTVLRIEKEFHNKIFCRRNFCSVKFIILLLRLYKSIDVSLIRTINPSFRLLENNPSNNIYSRIYSIKLFNFLPLLIKRSNAKNVEYLLLNILPILKIHSTSKSEKYSLFDFIPLIKINHKMLERNYEYYKNLSEKYYPAELRFWYKRAMKTDLNLENPQTYNEKIQWLKLHASTALKSRLSDKYLVRDWIKEKIGEKYLIPLIGAWDKFADIDFDKFPDKFVLKCNHGCGMNIIVTDKKQFNKEDARQKIEKWMKINFAYCVGLELQYKIIKPKIIAETYMENDDKDLYDYKFWCFDGKVHYIQFLSERAKGLKMAFFNRQWQKQEFTYNYPLNQDEITKPNNLDEMIMLAEKLSSGFSHVRVDFYRLNDGTIKFGEMTFTSASGYCQWQPKEWDLRLGKLINLSKEKN